MNIPKLLRQALTALEKEHAAREGQLRQLRFALGMDQNLKRRQMSPEQRAKLSKAMKERWKARRA